MSKILVLIDGFNFYHRLKEYQRQNSTCVKWLNYRKLIQCYFNDYKKHKFEYIYFSAIADFRGQQSQDRHETYIEALKKENIEIVLGKFKEKTMKRCNCTERCNGCATTQEKSLLIKHEEKNTDVNIAITLVEKAILKEYDSCYILSSDSDFDTAIVKAKNIYPQGRIVIVPPPLASNKSRKTPYYIQAVKKLTNSNPMFISWNNIQSSQFPNDFNGLKNPWI